MTAKATTLDISLGAGFGLAGLASQVEDIRSFLGFSAILGDCVLFFVLLFLLIYFGLRLLGTWQVASRLELAGLSAVCGFLGIAASILTYSIIANATVPTDYRGSIHRTCRDALQIEYRDYRDRPIGSGKVFADDSGYFCTSAGYWIDYIPRKIAVFCGTTHITSLPAPKVLKEGKCGLKKDT